MDLVAQARSLLARAEETFAGNPDAVRLAQARERLDGPLRVAIAGKVKAGKSTLLNALVGERLAPTDTGECTRIVTWYRDGHTYQVLLHPVDGSPPLQARFQRDDGAIDVDLAGRSSSDFDRIDITWPSAGLRTMTLIDTPGVGSLTEEVATRAFEFLDSTEAETPADAVLYLMKHIHASDLRLLESFHDTAVSQPNPVNAVAVLSRADEIGAGRLDSMTSARKIAKRYGDDGRLRRLIQVVVPVAGLLAETAETLTEWEFKSLKKLAAVPPRDLETHLLSADRFVEARPETPLTSLERQQLLDRFGLFGVRLSLALIRRNVVESSADLADELVNRSGLSDLQQILSTLFMDRADVLKARSALLAIERLCADNPETPGASDLLGGIEQVMAGAHPFNELTTMAAVRSGWVRGREDDLRDVEQLLGAKGTQPTQRLGIDPASNRDQIRAAALEALGRWQRKAENPLTSLDLVTASRVVIRTLEGMIAESS